MYNVKEILNKLGVKYIERPVGKSGVGYKISGKNMNCEIKQFGDTSFRVNVEVGRSSFSTEGQAIVINRDMPITGGSFLHIDIGHFNEDGSIDSSDFFVEEN